MPQPEAHARRIVVRRSFSRLAHRPLAGDQDEHLARLVVAQAHLPDLPLGFTRHLAGRRFVGGALRPFDLLGFEHLMEPQDERLELGLLAAQRQGPPRACGEEKKSSLAGLTDRRDGNAVDGIEFVNGHPSKSVGAGWFCGPGTGEEEIHIHFESNPSHLEDS